MGILDKVITTEHFINISPSLLLSKTRATDCKSVVLIGRKLSQNDRQVKVSFRELKAQIYWPSTDQKVRGSNPWGIFFYRFGQSMQKVMKEFTKSCEK